ncbi:hypothetical protein LguiA_000232 [Lonicera macranthoides]
MIGSFGSIYTIPAVQHLIERCLILHMDRDQCIKALAEHASIRPLITFTGTFTQEAFIGNAIKRNPPDEAIEDMIEEIQKAAMLSGKN